jgi:hypothetical protein
MTLLGLEHHSLSTEDIDKMVASLFPPDSVSPAQYLETVCRKTYVEAEQKLMLAVLEDAVTCFQGYFATRDKKEARLFCEAEDWILQQEKSDWLFSFDNVCETLGLNPGYIREGLLRWRHLRLREWDRVRLRVNRSRYDFRN